MDYNILNMKQAREVRAKIIADQRALVDLADKENRGFTEQEETNYRNMDVDFQTLTDRIKFLEEEEANRASKVADLEAREKELANSQEKVAKPEVDDVDSGGNANILSASAFRNSPEYKKAFATALGETVPHAALPRILHDERALQADTDIQGGYVVTPEEFIMDVIKQLENMVFVRKHAKVRTLTRAASISVPERIAMQEPEWAAEISTGPEDETMQYRKRTMFPHPLAMLIRISKTLVRLGAISIEAEVRDELSKRFAAVEERAFLNGTGSDQPLGVFVASNSGISTAQDVSAGNLNNAIKADGLVNCLYNMPAQYRTNARWLFHRDAIAMIRKLKTGDGQYIWQPGITNDRPDTILGKGLDESEYVPNTFTTGLYVGLLADWSMYWIFDTLNMQVQVLLELYARTNQNGYIGRKETDGQPIDERGFRRVTLT